MLTAEVRVCDVRPPLDLARQGNCMTDWIVLIAGVVCAGLGGEFFVRGSVGLARWLRVAPGIIGATVAAFATSSPELSVSVSAAVTGNSQIALGDALGSNVVNIALILGLALVISAIRSPRDTLRRDFPVALLVPVVTALFLIDGVLSRIDGMLMLAGFLAWLVVTIVHAKAQRSAVSEVLNDRGKSLAVLWCGLGLPLLMLAGILIVSGARGIAATLGVAPFVIGTTIVAVGTSVPELATTIIAKFRGHDEIGLGTVLGSNIFNGLLIVAVAAIIRPIHVDVRDVSVALAFGFVALLFALPPRNGVIRRLRGALLLLLYAGYIAAVTL
jgi:cation:H+ antiporter